MVGLLQQNPAGGAEGGTRFVAKLNGDEVSQGTAKAIHYWKARYPKEAGSEGYRDYGQPDLQKVPAAKMAQALQRLRGF